MGDIFVSGDDRAPSSSASGKMTEVIAHSNKQVKRKQPQAIFDQGSSLSTLENEKRPSDDDLVSLVEFYNSARTYFEEKC